ncbi:MAG: hypothetical protein QMC23_03440 [Rubritalea sp.]
MEPTEVDPYATPKSALTGTDNTTYLKEDGYAFQNELVANQHFKSPLICAKFGIPIPPESNIEPKNITVTRTPVVSKLMINLASALCFFLLCLCYFYIDPSFIFPAVIIYLLVTRILRYFFTTRYKIPFYFSEHYTRIRKRRIFIFTSLFLALIAIASTGIITRNYEYASLGFPAAIITLIVFKFKTAYFVVTQTKGEFHYIRGAHQSLLDALPYLPISP